MGTRPVSASDQRVVERGFSVLPPSSGNWCMDDVPGMPGVVFSTNDFIGKYVAEEPDMADVRHSFLVGAIAVRVKDADVSNREALRQFFTLWIQRGRGTVEIDGNLYADLSPASGTRLISSHVEVDPRTDADWTCRGLVDTSDRVTMP